MTYRILIILGLIVLTPIILAAHEKHEHGDEVKTMSAPTSIYQYLDPGAKAPDFTLINQDGKEVSMKELKGKPVILTPVYTSCPDACPLILYNRVKIEKSLEKDIGPNPIFIALTVDPAKDTPKTLKEFMNRLDMNPKNLHFLTGTPEKIDKALADYKIRVRIDAKEGQVLGHSVVGYAIDSDGIVKKAIQFAQ